jgi:hypothetical protein
MVARGKTSGSHVIFLILRAEDARRFCARLQRANHGLQSNSRRFTSGYPLFAAAAATTSIKFHVWLPSVRRCRGDHEA